MFPISTPRWWKTATSFLFKKPFFTTDIKQCFPLSLPFLVARDPLKTLQNFLTTIVPATQYSSSSTGSSPQQQFLRRSAALPLQFHFSNVPVPVPLSQGDASLVSHSLTAKGRVWQPAQLILPFHSHAHPSFSMEPLARCAYGCP